MLRYPLPVLLALIIVQASFSASPPPRQLFFQSDNMVWWGTDFGLNRFQTENELWSNIRPEKITDLCLDDKTMWVGTDHGVLYADLRYLDWKGYTAKQGLPSDSVVRLAADLDYVYVAGQHGLARFNKLVEQWEPMGDFNDKRVYDIYSNQTQLWVATDAGLFYFDKKFEKWENYTAATGLLSNTVFRIFFFNDYIWVLTDKGFSRYSSAMKAWNSYKTGDGIVGSSVDYMLVDASYIWVASPEGVARFSGKNQAWENFSRNMPIEKKRVFAISTSGTASWFATSDGVFYFAEDQRRWKTYTSVDGLSDDVQDEIYATGQTTICRKAMSYSYWHPTEDLWFSSQIKAMAGGANKAWKTHMDGSGLGATAPSGQSVNLLGRAYGDLVNSATFPEPLEKSIGNYLTNNNLDSQVITTKTDSLTGRPKLDTAMVSRYNDKLYDIVKGQLNLNADLGSGRTFRGTYDNTDPLGDLRYGAEYKGFGDDVLKRAGWRTDQKTDYFYSTLIDPTYLEGAGIRTELGDRVGDKKIRRVNTGLWAGWRKTRYLDTLVAFNESNFYDLEIPNIVTESVVIKIDGRVIDPNDYSIERTMGLLTFKNEGVANPDSRIEITCQYQPQIGQFTNEMVSAENVVAVNDKVSLGLNGLYRGIKEPNPAGNAQDTNRAFVGSVNAKIETKSKDGTMYLKAVPEISGSYDDSILVRKQGSAAKLDLYSAIKNLKLNVTGLVQERDYITLADQQSVYGRINNQLGGQAVYDLWQQYMPVTVGGAYTDASRGGENQEYVQYLISAPSLPSIRLYGMHEGIVNQTRFSRTRLVGQDTVPDDSIKTERLNAEIETEWGKSFRYFDRLWFNASYTINLISDTLDTTVTTLPTGRDSLVPAFNQRFNQNIFAWIRLSPVKKLQLEVKYVHRIFMDRDSMAGAFAYRGMRLWPEFKLFSQELVPGITLYGDYLLQSSDFIISPDSSATLFGNNLNTSMLVVPGVYWRFLNPFQLNLGYNVMTADSVNHSGLSAGNFPTDQTMQNSLSQTYSFKPILDFSEDLHFDSRTDLSSSSNFSVLTGNSMKIYNTFRTAFWERKTRFDVDFNILDDDKYSRYASLADSSLVKSRTLELQGKWTERWKPAFRTELDLVAGNQYQDYLVFDPLSTVAVKDSATGYLNTFSPGVLFDWWKEGKVIRQFRVQYYIGLQLAGGHGVDWSTFDETEQNKLDIQVKAGANFFLRLLLNVDYDMTKLQLKYDMAELKATALF